MYICICVYMYKYKVYICINICIYQAAPDLIHEKNYNEKVISVAVSPDDACVFIYICKDK